MVSTKEKEKWILENCVDENGNIDLSGLDFSEFNGSVNTNGMKVKDDLFQCGQEVKGSLYQCDQVVGRDLNQNFQEVKGDLIQSYQEVDGKLYQQLQEVKGNLYQYSHNVEGEIMQIENYKNKTKIIKKIDEIEHVTYKLI